MKITILVDNNTLIDTYLIGEPGVCYLIEQEGKSILFDTGYSDAFILNALSMGIDLRKLDYIVFSHGHNDHTWGLMHLIQYYNKINFLPEKEIQIIAHPEAWFKKRENKNVIGSLLTPDSLPPFFNVINTTEPFCLGDELFFLGEIPRLNPFEAQETIGECRGVGGKYVSDSVRDDSALAYNGKEGLVIITGCSHSGVCNIIDYGMTFFKQEKIQSVIGGFHLLNAEREQLDFTAQFFSSLNARVIYPCHCTDLAAKIALSKTANIAEVGTGSVFDFY